MRLPNFKSIDRGDQCYTIIFANNMVYDFIEICAKLPMCNDIPCDSPDYSVADIF